MMLRSLARLLVASRVLHGVLGYGTTVSIAVSYCPATTSLATGTVAPTQTPSGIPYLIYLIPESATQLPKRDNPSSYIASDGTIASDPAAAAEYRFDGTGRLSTNGGYISTTGQAAYQNFAPSPVLGAVSTFFSINTNNTLSWINDAFSPQSARFCSFSAVVQVVFKGSYPQGCNPVQLGVIQASLLPKTSTMSSTSGVAQSPTIIRSATTKSQSSVLGLTSIPSVASSGSLTLAPTSSTNSAYPAPTTTGAPNCFDGSGFDGTVDANYLILCDTALPGYDLNQVDATDLADCIEHCNSAKPESDGSTCVAVEYDILASTKPCSLKYNIGPVNRGGNPFAQAAVLVNQPSSPTISFGSGSSSAASSTTISTSELSVPSSSPLAPTSSPLDASSTPASLSSTFASTSSSAVMPTLVLSSAVTTPIVNPSSTTSVTSILSSSSAAPLANSPSTPVLSVSTSSRAVISIGTLSSASTATSIVTSSAAPRVSSSSTSTGSLSTTASTTSGLVVYPTPTASLCPNFNHQVLNVNGDNYNYEIECGTLLNGAALVANSSTATSLNNCVRFCNVYNIALPFQCLGVNYYPNYPSGQINCYLLSTVTSNTCVTQGQAARLIYDGYPSPTDVNCAAPSTTAAIPASSTVQASSAPLVTPSLSTTRPASPSSSAGSTSSSIIVLPSSVSSSSIAAIIIPTTTTRPTTAISTMSTSTGSTSSTSFSACPTAPAANTECANSPSTPSCYSYSQFNGQANFEIECATQFTGAGVSYGLMQSLADCINYCQYANGLKANSCIGVTYRNGNIAQGTPNNCYQYSTITCATRGNTTVDSARILAGSYTTITDYDASFNCR